MQACLASTRLAFVQVVGMHVCVRVQMHVCACACVCVVCECMCVVCECMCVSLSQTFLKLP